MSSAHLTREEANKQVVQQLFPAFKAGDQEAMDPLFAPDFQAHGMPPGFATDVRAIKQMCAAMHAGLSQCHNTRALIAEGDLVAVRYTTRAVHSGELFGVAPTGRTLTLTGIEIYRLDDGKIAEFWGEANMSDLFEPAQEQPVDSLV